ncbi:hypothetical protein BXT89_12755 [Halopseudomonas pachastrellae]|uniref:Uncharacterized protein n=1 Tax=Halopseudomonas pachastrellae TaxID=254161 RepID=A0A1S8DDH4_9GAMM|nr:hypothetical protein BXT89_12755 [Halopseudomonas pachastrellae]
MVASVVAGLLEVAVARFQADGRRGGALANHRAVAIGDLEVRALRGGLNGDGLLRVIEESFFRALLILLFQFLRADHNQ